MADYSKMTDEDFTAYLDEQINRMSAAEVASIPGVSEILVEALNNDVLDAWAQDHPELAHPEDYEDEDEE